MDVVVKKVRSARERKDFLRLPGLIYAGDPRWVQPLTSSMKRSIDPRGNGHLRKGPHCLFVAYQDNRPAGRVMAGINAGTNAARGTRDGWFALFETIEDFEVARALLNAARAFLKAAGCERMFGPLSPTGGDDYRGLLVLGYDSPPVLMDSYNPQYYRHFLERYGFVKDYDWLAYRFAYRMPKNPEVVAYAQKRYGFRLDRLDLSKLAREVRDIHDVVNQAMPAWPDTLPPSMEEVWEMAENLRRYADPDFIYIARAGDEPVGFSVAMPDLNQALIHLRGRLLPWGWAKFLYWRRRIEALRFFVLFVVPAWQKKGVTAAIYVRIFETAARKGIKWAEGSTIREMNEPMRRDAEKAGGEHYKTYRIYMLPL